MWWKSLAPLFKPFIFSNLTTEQNLNLITWAAGLTVNSSVVDDAEADADAGIDSVVDGDDDVDPISGFEDSWVNCFETRRWVVIWYLLDDDAGEDGSEARFLGVNLDVETVLDDTAGRAANLDLKVEEST